MTTTADVIHARGRAESEARILLRLLKIRFGPVPGPVQAQVRRATTAQLETWDERVLTAATLDEVLV